jgi:hypothetical protein
MMNAMCRVERAESTVVNDEQRKEKREREQSSDPRTRETPCAYHTFGPNHVTSPSRFPHDRVDWGQSKFQ